MDRQARCQHVQLAAPRARSWCAGTFSNFHLRRTGRRCDQLGHRQRCADGGRAIAAGAPAGGTNSTARACRAWLLIADASRSMHRGVVLLESRSRIPASPGAKPDSSPGKLYPPPFQRSLNNFLNEARRLLAAARTRVSHRSFHWHRRHIAEPKFTGEIFTCFPALHKAMDRS